MLNQTDRERIGQSAPAGGLMGCCCGDTTTAGLQKTMESIPKGIENDPDAFFRGATQGRPRPSRQIPDYIFRSINTSPTPLHVISDGPVRLEWVRPKWKALDYDLKAVQQRTLRGLVWQSDILLGAVEFSECRNATHRAMSFDEFILICDADSQGMEAFAGNVVATMNEFDPGRDFLYPREAFAEFSTLFLLPDGRGHLPRWEGVINKLILTEYVSKGFSGFVLEALPLEYKGSSKTDPLYQRRLTAMIKLYGRSLSVGIVSRTERSAVMGCVF